jgi:hypothetical protein
MQCAEDRSINASKCKIEKASGQRERINQRGKRRKKQPNIWKTEYVGCPLHCTVWAFFN